MNEQNLHRLVEHLQQILGDRLDAVVLFGSRARGEGRADSDWDLLIVVRDLPRSPLKRWRWFRQKVEPPLLDVDIPLKTPEEWYEHLSSLTLDIALDGVILYDAPWRMHRFLEKIKRALKEAGLQRERVQEGYLWRDVATSAKETWYKRVQGVLAE